MPLVLAAWAWLLLIGAWMLWIFDLICRTAGLVYLVKEVWRSRH